MEGQTEVLRGLARELYSDAELPELLRIASSDPLDRLGLARFDLSLGGPSVLTIAHGGTGPGTLGIPRYGVGRYEIADRAIFRPLQYCAIDLLFLGEGIEWRTREIVETSSAHIEGLIKRVGRLRFLPLGTALRKASVKKALDARTWDQVARFTPIYNESKHHYEHEMDTHLYSMEDATLAYFVCRRLGSKLYPLASLSTDMSVFSGEPFPAMDELERRLAT